MTKLENLCLADSTADLLIYGMGEKPIVAVAENLKNGVAAKDITYVQGNCYTPESLENIQEYIDIPSYKEVCVDKYKYAEASKFEYEDKIQ